MTVSVKAPTSTTGSIQLNGSDVLTIDSSGNVTAPNKLISTGHVLQVVSTSPNQGGSAFSTSSTSFIDSGFSLSITPSSTSSKILVIANGAMTQTLTGGTGCLATIYRGATNLANGATNGFAYYENSTSSGFQWVSGTMVTLDSPSTTSSTTYKIYVRAVNNGAGAGTAYYSINYAGNGITLMEIAG
jgi:hypothetical protein